MSMASECAHPLAMLIHQVLLAASKTEARLQYSSKSRTEASSICISYWEKDKRSLTLCQGGVCILTEPLGVLAALLAVFNWAARMD
jgi:hypothetical protein